MQILEIIIPVIACLLLGMVFAKQKMLSREAMNGIKLLVSRILLPIVIFNALITTQFTKNSLILSLLVYMAFTIFLGTGFLVRPVFGEYKKIGPFLLGGAEGGMLAYPLYITLYGAQGLSTLMTIDLGNILFAFTFFIVLISIETNENADKKAVIKSSLTHPLVITVVIAIILNVTGLGSTLLGSPISGIYSNTIRTITAPITVLVLLSVGYDLKFDTHLLKPVFKVSFIRMFLMVTALGLFMLLRGSLITEQGLVVAFVLYFFLPPQFITPMFVENEKEKMYVSTAISFYALLAILAYVLITVFLPLT